MEDERELPKQLDVSEVFRKSWEHYKRNWQVLTAVTLGVGVVSYVVNGMADDSPGLYSILSLAVGAVTQLVIINASLAAARGKLEAGQVWARMGRILPLFAVSLLVGLLVGVGFMLLIVPGIMLAVALQLAQYVVVDKKKGVVESLYASADLTRGVRWKLLIILVLIVVINVLGAIPFALGLLVTVPLSSVVLADVYERLTTSGVGRRVRAV